MIQVVNSEKFSLAGFKEMARRNVILKFLVKLQLLPHGTFSQQPVAFVQDADSCLSSILKNLLSGLLGKPMSSDRKGMESTE